MPAWPPAINGWCRALGPGQFAGMAWECDMMSPRNFLLRTILGNAAWNSLESLGFLEVSSVGAVLKKREFKRPYDLLIGAGSG